MFAVQKFVEMIKKKFIPLSGMINGLGLLPPTAPVKVLLRGINFFFIISSKVITFSRYFPAYQTRKGEPTYFVEQIQNSLISMNWEIDLYKNINPPMNLS